MSDEMRENGVIEQPMMTPSCPNGQLYTIKSGDTMFAIARRYNVSLQSLIDANPQIVDPNIIRPGQVICIPVTGQGIACPGGHIYRVVRGDTMYEIARRNNISLDALVAANPQIKDPSEIFPGQEICIPWPSTVTCPGRTLYIVKAGDTMFDIARRYNISLSALVAANPQVTNPDRISIGQVLCIPRAVPGEIPQVPPDLIAPIPVPAVPPVSPIPLPMPTPMPSMPMPTPAPPISPLPTVPPGVRPCPPSYGQMPICPMPVYVVVPWDECPYRQRNKRDRKDRRCR